ncbi:unnamed protein product [marine sediment metagenome]|uniref:Uncharacterized protein n=1 Tax=marine sediment metagenome TaxID=412755 RepID=X1HDN6_9ZZZZ
MFKKFIIILKFPGVLYQLYNKKLFAWYRIIIRKINDLRGVK